MAYFNFNSNRTSEDYRFCTRSTTDQQITKLKEMASRHNENVRRIARDNNYVSKYLMLKRVRVMPRGPRDTANVGRRYWTYLPMYTGLATHFDVYYSDDSTATYELKREIETGMKPGELKRFDALQRAAWLIEIEGKQRVYQRSR